jgi:RNA polymerase sigma-70 factor (ECF subfamily)
MSEGALRVETTRMRKRFREILRAEIAETVGSEQDLDDELRHLMTSWAGGT